MQPQPRRPTSTQTTRAASPGSSPACERSVYTSSWRAWIQTRVSLEPHRANRPGSPCSKTSLQLPSVLRVKHRWKSYRQVQHVSSKPTVHTSSYGKELKKLPTAPHNRYTQRIATNPSEEHQGWPYCSSTADVQLLQDFSRQPATAFVKPGLVLFAATLSPCSQLIPAQHEGSEQQKSRAAFQARDSCLVWLHPHHVAAATAGLKQNVKIAEKQRGCIWGKRTTTSELKSVKLDHGQI